MELFLADYHLEAARTALAEGAVREAGAAATREAEEAGAAAGGEKCLTENEARDVRREAEGAAGDEKCLTKNEAHDSRREAGAGATREEAGATREKCLTKNEARDSRPRTEAETHTNAREHLAEADRRVNAMGYHRRDGELAELREALGD